MRQGQKDPELLEAALSTLVNVCVDHGPNCRRLLVQGLDMLVELAEAGAAARDRSQQHEQKRGGDDESEYGETNGALASDLLQIVGPFNYIVCANCGHRNESGTTCVLCGHAIAFDMAEAKQEVARAAGVPSKSGSYKGSKTQAHPPAVPQQ